MHTLCCCAYTMFVHTTKGLCGAYMTTLKIIGEIKKRLLRGRLMASWACVMSSQPCCQPSLDSVRSSLMRRKVGCSWLPWHEGRT